MVIHELSPVECLQVLARARHGRLACARDGQPYVVPFFYYLDAPGYCLFSFSTLGQKIEWMRSNPKVCVEVDDIVDQFNWTTVLVFGRYDEVGDASHDRDSRRRAHELFRQRSVWWLPGVGKSTAGDEHHTPIVYRIQIDKLTGRRAARAS